MISIPIRPIWLRLVILLALSGVFGTLGWLLVRAAIGASISTYLGRNPNLTNTARLAGADSAARYAAQDPFVRWQRGATYLAVAAEEDTERLLPQAVAELREAARLSPADYRIWLALGRALDRSGATAEATTAFTRATQSAPNHFETQWSLGNHLLRADQRAAAFVALRAALRTRPVALPLIFDYAWNAFAGDGAAVIQALSADDATRNRYAGQFAAQLIQRQRLPEALALWRTSGAHSNAETLALIQSLASAGHFQAAFELWQAAKEPTWPPPDAGSQLANGSFEQNFDPQTTLPLLSWRATPNAGVLASLDQQQHAAGALSLRLRFDVADNQPLLLATQTAPVRPNTNYCLRFAVKTEALQSLSNVLVGVYDAANEQRLSVVTPPFANGTSDWTETKLSFTTKPETEAVTLRLQRLPCGEPPCPLTGRLWLDNFILTECQHP